MTSQRKPEAISEGTLAQALVRLKEGIERLASERLVNRDDAQKRHEEILALLTRVVGKPLADPVTLNDLEREIVEALGKETLTGEKIAARIHRPYDSNLKAALAGMRRRGILGNRCPGYYVIRQSHDSGQD